MKPLLSPVGERQKVDSSATALATAGGWLVMLRLSACVRLRRFAARVRDFSSLPRNLDSGPTWSPNACELADSVLLCYCPGFEPLQIGVLSPLRFPETNIRFGRSGGGQPCAIHWETLYGTVRSLYRNRPGCLW